MQRAEAATEQTSLALEPATERTFAVELAEAELVVAAAVATVAKSAQLGAVVAALEEVAPVLKCPLSLVLPRVARLDQCFAAVQPSLDSSR